MRILKGRSPCVIDDFTVNFHHSNRLLYKACRPRVRYLDPPRPALDNPLAMPVPHLPDILAQEAIWRAGAPAQVYMSVLPLYASQFSLAGFDGRIAYHVCRHPQGLLSTCRVDETGQVQVLAVVRKEKGLSRHDAELLVYGEAVARMEAERQALQGHICPIAPAELTGEQLQAVYDAKEALTGVPTPVVTSNEAYLQISQSALKAPLLDVMEEGSLGHKLLLTMIRAMNGPLASVSAHSANCTVLAYLISRAEESFPEGSFEALQWLRDRVNPARLTQDAPILPDETAAMFLSRIPANELTWLQRTLRSHLPNTSDGRGPVRCPLIDLLARNPALCMLHPVVQWVGQNHKLETSLGPLASILGLTPKGTAVTFKSVFRKPTRLHKPSKPTARSMHLPVPSHA